MLSGGLELKSEVQVLPPFWQRDNPLDSAPFRTEEAELRFYVRVADETLHQLAGLCFRLQIVDINDQIGRTFRQALGIPIAEGAGESGNTEVELLVVAEFFAGCTLLGHLP